MERTIPAIIAGFQVFLTKYIEENILPILDIGKVAEQASANGGTSNGNGISTPNNSPVYDYPTLKKREKLTSTIEEWLNFINMNQYLARYDFLSMNYGYT